MEVPTGQVNSGGSLSHSASNVFEPMLHPDKYSIHQSYAMCLCLSHSLPGTEGCLQTLTLFVFGGDSVMWCVNLLHRLAALTIPPPPPPPPSSSLALRVSINQDLSRQCLSLRSELETKITKTHTHWLWINDVQNIEIRVHKRIQDGP